MCEIEHFVDPADKAYSKFEKVADLELTLFTKQNQMQGVDATRMSIGKAVREGIVDNETLGYYMARTHLYLLQVGVDGKRLRFRQHLDNEMAHYAKVLRECVAELSYQTCSGLLGRGDPHLIWLDRVRRPCGSLLL